MKRLNLSNYHKVELKYKLIKFLCFIGIGLLLGVVVNIFYIFTIDNKISRQESRNSYLKTQITIVDNKIIPIKTFDTKLDALTKKINLINVINKKRYDSVILVQNLDKIIPKQTSFTAITINTTGNTITLTGNTRSPLYLSKLLDNINESNIIFDNPILKNNSTKDQKVYNFEINAIINKDKFLVESRSEEN